jgi:hypothetical protein
MPGHFQLDLSCLVSTKGDEDRSPAYLCLPVGGTWLTIDDLGLLGTRHIRSQLSLRDVR